MKGQSERPRHLLRLDEWSLDQLTHVLELSAELKERFVRGEATPLLRGRALAMIFQKPSTRTRVSFEVAMTHLGGSALYLGASDLQLSRGETIADTARVLSRYCDAIAARVYAHRDVEELAQYSRVPVINALSDDTHPCQLLADLLTLREKRGRLEGLQLAYVGDGNNVAHSLLFGAALLGAHLRLGTPPDYAPRARFVERARELAKATGSRLELLQDPCAAVQDADVIYTDTWASMGQEAEHAERRKRFAPYQVNSRLLQAARTQALVMHCLPAHRGEEITDEVMDGPQSVVWEQAENRLHAQKGLLAYLVAGE